MTNKSNFVYIYQFYRGIIVRKIKICLSMMMLITSLQSASAGLQISLVNEKLQSASNSEIQTVAVRCGPGTFENHRGVCRPASERRAYSNRACPPGYHLGPHRKWCWPN
jgi:hypothetical protein